MKAFFVDDEPHDGRGFFWNCIARRLGVLMVRTATRYRLGFSGFGR